MNTFDRLENVRKKRGGCAMALIDPDVKNDSILSDLVNEISENGFDGIMVGGSLIMDNQFEDRIGMIRQNSHLPVIIFPGASTQLSSKADAILYLSLLSGRNPQYLIGEQVQSAPKIHSLGLEVIPTGYLLLDGGVRSSVEVMSNTNPLPMSKKDIVLAHALAGQYFGMKLIFLEAGSGAKQPVPPEMVVYLSSILSIPLMIGGGIRTTESARALVEAGAGYVVTGTILESKCTSSMMKSLTDAIHILEN